MALGEPGKKFALQLVAGEIAAPILFVLDGMDEMAVSEYLERVSAIAAFMGDARRRAYLFLVTCRYEDFVKLADHTHNVQVQRFDLLPWTLRMTRDYLKNKMPADQARASEIVEILRDRERRRTARYFNPIEVAFLAEVGPWSGAALHELFEIYVRTRLADLELSPGPRSPATGKCVVCDVRFYPRLPVRNS